MRDSTGLGTSERRSRNAKIDKLKEMTSKLTGFLGISPRTKEEALTRKPSHVWRRLYKNSAALGFAQIVNAAGNLLLVPLFLSYWSKEVYGEWMALSAVVAYYGTADLGMNAASGNALIKAYQRKEWQKYREIQASALLFYIGMACVITALAAATCFLLPVTRWLGIVHIPRTAAVLVMCLLAGRIVWTMPAGQIWNIFRTTGNLSTSQWIANLQMLGVIVATAAVLCRGGGVTTLAAWTWCPLVVCALLAWLLVRRSHEDLLPRLQAASLRGVTVLIKPSLLFALMMVATVIRVNGPVIVVVHALGGAAVAVLVTTRTLANVVGQIPAILCWALWPELTRLDAIGDKAGLQAAHSLLVAAYMAISLTFVGALWFEGQELIEVWTRGRLSVEPWLVRTFLLYILCQAPWMASSMIAGATNRHQKLARCQFLASVAGVGFVVAFLPNFKLVAVPLGLLAGEALACYHFVVADACALTDTPYPKFATRVWLTLAIVTLLTLAIGAFAHRLPIVFVPLRVMIAGTVSGLISTVGIWKFLLHDSDRQLLTRSFMRFVPCSSASYAE
jgi:O-antigen/teichoic acid export membrane protein